MKCKTSRGWFLYLGVMLYLLLAGSTATTFGDVVSYTTQASTVAFEFDDDLVTAPSPWTGTVVTADDSLTIHPNDFTAESMGANPIITSLNSTFVVRIIAADGFLINSITVNEQGDFDFWPENGGATALTQVQVKGGLFSTVKVNGQSILLPQQTMTFSQNPMGPFNQTGSYNAVDTEEPWEWYGKATLDIAAALSGGGATEVVLSISNRLRAMSEASTVASIAKEQCRIGVETVVIPEPSMIALLMAGGCLVLAQRRR